MESLLSVGGGYTCDQSCYNSSNNLSHSINCKHHHSKQLNPGGGRVGHRARFIAEIDEIRINPIVSKKGYLNFLDDKSAGWAKRFVTVRRPYVFIYNSERDLIERSLINLSTAQIVYNEEQIEMFKVSVSNQLLVAIFSFI